MWVRLEFRLPSLFSIHWQAQPGLGACCSLLAGSKFELWLTVNLKPEPLAVTLPATHEVWSCLWLAKKTWESPSQFINQPRCYGHTTSGATWGITPEQVSTLLSRIMEHLESQFDLTHIVIQVKFKLLRYITAGPWTPSSNYSEPNAGCATKGHCYMTCHFITQYGIAIQIVSDF